MTITYCRILELGQFLSVFVLFLDTKKITKNNTVFSKNNTIDFKMKHFADYLL